MEGEKDEWTDGLGKPATTTGVESQRELRVTRNISLGWFKISPVPRAKDLNVPAVADVGSVIGLH